jgi:hypothetical protein
MPLHGRPAKAHMPPAPHQPTHPPTHPHKKKTNTASTNLLRLGCHPFRLSPLLLLVGSHVQQPRRLTQPRQHGSPNCVGVLPGRVLPRKQQPTADLHAAPEAVLKAGFTQGSQPGGGHPRVEGRPA